MAKVKNTKNELKRQKDALKRFTRYLPTLTLKKQQLQIEIAKAASAVKELEGSISELLNSVAQWAAVFGEDIALQELIKIGQVRTSTENIAGVDLPVFDSVDLQIREYDLMSTPLWLDFGIEAVKKLVNLRLQSMVMQKKQALLAEELSITTQRVNLFEKIKIPESRENIRKINIVLGDMQTAAVVTGKIAKHKIELKHAAA
jgi:V/A-type H+/Na+-transporting ATPase subunit D